MICEGFLLFCSPANAMFIIQESVVVMFSLSLSLLMLKVFFLIKVSDCKQCHPQELYDLFQVFYHVFK